MHGTNHGIDVIGQPTKKVQQDELFCARLIKTIKFHVNLCYFQDIVNSIDQYNKYE